MRKRLNISYILLFCTVFFLSALNAQQDVLNAIEIQQNTRFIEVDHMNQLYCVSGDHSIYKYNDKGELLYTFSENRLGQISQLDVSNPLRILVYFSDFTTLIYLDRTLSEISRQDLSTIDFAQTQTIAQASDNNIWFFDNERYTLKKINEQNNIIFESNDLNLLLETDIYPIKLKEFELQLYLNAPENGILVFDLFGNFIKTIGIQSLDYFQLMENQLFYLKDGKLNSYNLTSFQHAELDIPLPWDEALQVCIGQDKIYLRKLNIVSIYTYTKK